MHHLLFDSNSTPYKTELKPAEEFIALSFLVEAWAEGGNGRTGSKGIDELRQRGSAILSKSGKNKSNETKLLNLFVTSRELREVLTSVS